MDYTSGKTDTGWGSRGVVGRSGSAERIILIVRWFTTV